MDIISILNIINAQDCLRNASFQQNWLRYKSQIDNFLGENPSESRVLKLGSWLSRIFSLDNESARDQSDVSVSGNAWSRLVNWYLNMCLIGTNCWAVNSSDLVPSQVKRALSLQINNQKVQNSKEIIIMGYFGKNVPEVSIPNDFDGIDLKINYSQIYKHFFNSIDLADLRVVLLSAKTNCSDMLAIPLFWNFCYKGNNLDMFGVKVGNERENPEKFIDEKVLYSIVTVPSGRESKILDGTIPGQAALNKLQLLDGGFYWGRPSTEKVNSFEHFIADNFGEISKNAGKIVSDDYNYKDSPRSLLYKLFNI
ncbi:hypothetical protein MMB75_16435 [Paenibacillus sp. P2(2022)]|uniref:hypothetical protein n=1 Tax=Paenibacillus TaxID=44249 RepID=UPI0003190847|nr:MULTISPECIES: hypothetical protein [Paenibacillus]MDG0055271.1 hypothetical protein [Paenibacillus sp. P2(2022)]NMP08315.1 hypothetical protein [Paenibacillus polymyxa]